MKDKNFSLSYFFMLIVLVQEFSTSNLYFFPYSFYLGGFVYSNLSLLFFAIISIYPMVVLVNLKWKTGMNMWELVYLKWKKQGLFATDLFMFITHVSFFY